jgi:DNA invertase Pin-like site-specific DNA recombinase
MRIFTDQASSSPDQRPHLDNALDHLQEGSTLVVWRLHRVGRSLRHLIDTVTPVIHRGRLLDYEVYRER